MSKGGNYRILVIDDNSAIHDDFIKILEERRQSHSDVDRAAAALFGDPLDELNGYDFEIDSSYQGVEGLERVRNSLAEGRPYAMAFVDIRMPPGWDGIETIERLWREDPALQVVICTAYSDYTSEEIMSRLGRTDRLLVLKKPFDNIEIRQLAYALSEKWDLAAQVQTHVAGLESKVRERTADLEHSLSITQATLESTTDGILVVNDAGEIVCHNRRFLQMWNIPESVIESRNDGEALAHVFDQLIEPEKFLEKVRALYAEPAAESFDTCEFLDGRVFERYSMPQSIGGAIVGRVWSFRDVTERRRAEMELKQTEEKLRSAQKMETVGNLAGGIAHDFNNLLMVINGYSKLLLDRASEGDLSAGPLLEIYKAGERAALMTNQLLAFSRRQVLAPKVVNINKTVSSMTKMLARLIGEGIDLVDSLASNLWNVQVDSAQLDQVILNLAVNARDAMKDCGKLTIETGNVVLDEHYTTTHPYVTPGEYAMLAVSDSGCGMDGATQARIFEPFFTTKEAEKGTGMGLATVYGIVKQSGGHIEVYSELGVGTTFKIYFPRCCAAQAPKGNGSQTLATGYDGVETILLVEDEDGVRRFAREVLTERGYKVIQAADGEAAVTIAEEHDGEIDLLLTDVIMPKMNGRHLSDRIRRDRPAIKTLYMSGYTDTAIARHGILQEGILFLQKPFTHDTLLRKIRQILDPVENAPSVASGTASNDS